jgi:pyruvate,orthophosphate dikinase
MPGMMDTVLNLGLNDTIVLGLAKQQGERFAYDCYRRLMQMFGDVVLGVPHEDFERCLSALKERRNVKLDIELNAEDLKGLCDEYKAVRAVLPCSPSVITCCDYHNCVWA